MISKKTFLIINIIIIGIFFLVTSLTINYFDQQYREEIINNNAIIVSAVIRKNPELKEEVINSLLTSNDSESGLKILNDHGIDAETLIYYKNVDDLKSQLFFNIFIILVIMLILVILLILHFYLKIKRSLLKTHSLIIDTLNDKETEINIYEDGLIGSLNSDIKKVIIKLKEEKEKSLKDKIELTENLSDISHQLKTPLTSMYVINDLLKDENLPQNIKQDILNKNQNQLERIEWLIKSILKISMLDSGTVVLKSEKINVKELIESAVEPLRIPIELKNQIINVEINDDTLINGDFNWLRESLINIIKNATEHTKDLIEIKVLDNPIYTEIRIRDNGEGIKKKDLLYIFDRFYRSSVLKESIGIGLNMSKKIIEKQNGLIKAESKEGEYTEFIIKFFKVTKLS